MNQSIVDKVLDRLGANDGFYEFCMENFQRILRRKGIGLTKLGYIDYKPKKSFIDLIKFIRNTAGFFTPDMPGLKASKDCCEGDGILVGYFTAQTRDIFINELKTFGIDEDNYIFTKKEKSNGPDSIE